MQALYEWIRNLTCYLLFMTVAINLLPDKKYEKYLRFFFGMVFLLLVIQPFTRGLRIEEKLSYYFESFTLQNDAAALQKQLLGAESIRLEQIFGRYQDAVAEDVSQLARAAGFEVVKAEVQLGRDADSPEYGRVTHIRLALTFEGAKELEMSLSGPAAPNLSEAPAKGDPITVPITAIDRVSVGQAGAGQTGMGRADAVQAEAGLSTSLEAHSNEYAALRMLRKQLRDYYDLEENDVEIQVQNESR